MPWVYSPTVGDVVWYDDEEVIMITDSPPYTPDVTEVIPRGRTRARRFSLSPTAARNLSRRLFSPAASKRRRDEIK